MNIYFSILTQSYDSVVFLSLYEIFSDILELMQPGITLYTDWFRAYGDRQKKAKTAFQYK